MFKKCVVCCESFDTKKRGASSKTCSDKCREIHQRESHNKRQREWMAFPHSRGKPKECIVCGNQFYTKNRGSSSKTCSVECGKINLRALWRKPWTNQEKREERKKRNHKWRTNHKEEIRQKTKTRYDQKKYDPQNQERNRKYYRLRLTDPEYVKRRREYKHKWLANPENQKRMKEYQHQRYIKKCNQQIFLLAIAITKTQEKHERKNEDHERENGS